MEKFKNLKTTYQNREEFKEINNKKIKFTLIINFNNKKYYFNFKNLNIFLIKKEIFEKLIIDGNNLNIFDENFNLIHFDKDYLKYKINISNKKLIELNFKFKKNEEEKERSLVIDKINKLIKSKENQNEVLDKILKSFN
jgi:hypothetical protein